MDFSVRMHFSMAIRNDGSVLSSFSVDAFTRSFLPAVEFLYSELSLCKKGTIHQVTTMLATSKNVLFPGHNHLLTTDADDPLLWLSPSPSVPVVSRWLWPENRTFLEVASMVVTWWIVDFLSSVWRNKMWLSKKWMYCITITFHSHWLTFCIRRFDVEKIIRYIMTFYRIVRKGENVDIFVL